ncbi:MAG: YidC/Oxa1 family membrane protein insertase [Hominimerdicola sp.]
MNIIAAPLGWIMKGCYYLVQNYGLALLMFTILVKLITFPLQVKQEKNMAKTQLLAPELEKLKKKYDEHAPPPL